MSEILTNLLNDFLTLADGSTKVTGLWREEPVDLLTFFTHKDFLKETPYPGKQTLLLEIVGDILWWKLTDDESKCPESLREVTEIIAMLGKGSGKDFLVSGIIAYVCYLLCCMNDPQSHFGFGQDEPIDIINVAINANQANGVFFKKLKARLTNCKWFKKVTVFPSNFNEYQFTKNQIRLYKNITAHSAHSEADSFEGFNPLVVVFDEIGGYEIDKAESSYATLRSSAASRYNDKMLLIFISYPRAMDDMIMRKYKEATEGNDPQVYAMKGKSWEVNPKIKREHLEKDYITDPEGAAIRYESLTGDTQIWTVDGAFRIDELYDSSLIRTMYGTREVSKFINSGSKSIYEVTTREGYTIRGSINHPMKIFSNKKNWKDSVSMKWKTIGELNKGDLLQIDLNNDLFGEATMSKDMALMIGGLIADGTFQQRKENRGYATWYFGKNSELINTYISAFEREFGFTPQIKTYKSRDDQTIRTDKQEVIQKFITSGLKYGTAHTKEIPKEIFRQPKDIIIEFLKGLFDADGTINKNHGNAIYCTVNNKLAKQLQQLLLMVGIRSRLLNSKHSISESSFAGKDGYLVYLTKQESVVFNNLVQLNLSYKRENQQLCMSFDDCKNYNYQLPFVRVKEVKYVGEEECYDLWVEPENEFVANGLVAHNCEPPAYRDGFFRFPEKIAECVHIGKNSQCNGLLIEEKISTRTLNNGVEKHFIGLEIHNLVLDPSFTYYIGGDGGVITDSYIISLFHAELALTQVIENGETVDKWFNKPIEDLTLEWRPSKKDRLPVDLLNVADVLEMICKQVFVKKALFDKFNSAEVVQRLMLYGVDAEDKNWSNPFQVLLYTNMKTLIYTGQVELLDYVSPYEDVSQGILNPNEELKAIKILNGNKIDHDSNKAKDFSDARVAAVYICATDEPDTVEHYAMPVISGAKRK